MTIFRSVHLLILLISFCWPESSFILPESSFLRSLGVVINNSQLQPAPRQDLDSQIGFNFFRLCLFNETKADHFGGAITLAHYPVVASTTLTIERCQFVRTAAENHWGGGVYCLGITSVIITESGFMNNTAVAGGGLLIGLISSCVHTGSTSFTNCRGTQWRGGASYATLNVSTSCSPSTTVGMLYRVTFRQCVSDEYAPGGLSLDTITYAPFFLSEIEFRQCSAKPDASHDGGGALHLETLTSLHKNAAFLKYVTFAQSTVGNNVGKSVFIQDSDTYNLFPLISPFDETSCSTDGDNRTYPVSLAGKQNCEWLPACK